MCLFASVFCARGWLYELTYCNVFDFVFFTLTP
jgi:hypothetical protein